MMETLVVKGLIPFSSFDQIFGQRATFTVLYGLESDGREGFGQG